MRFKNFSSGQIVIPYRAWAHPSDPIRNRIEVSVPLEPGEVTTDFPEDHPLVQLMLKAHPELRPFVLPSIWQRLRNPEL